MSLYEKSLVKEEDLVTWKEMIIIELENNEETWKNVVSCTLTEEGLNKKFDNGYGGTNGDSFTCWTTNYVYFPVQYDGSEWCGSTPRNPGGGVTNHIGG